MKCEGVLPQPMPPKSSVAAPSTPSALPLVATAARHSLVNLGTASGSKAAKTEMQVLERFPGATLIEAKPISGRTHQIRVHTQHVGHPILGDNKYQNDQSQAVSATAGLKRLFLHARAITFELGGDRYELECPLDAELESVLRQLRGQR